MTMVLAEPKTEPQSRGGLWDYISPSRLNLWLGCPRAFEFRYVKGIHTPTSPSLFIGKQVHAALELHYRHRQLDLLLPSDEILTRMRDEWIAAAEEEHVAFAKEGDSDKLMEKACTLVLAYLAQIPDDEPRPLAVETMLEVPLIDTETGVDLGIPMRGIIDLVLDERDGAVICDFKTAASSQQPLEVCHEIQLGCYALMYRALSGEVESGLEIRTLVKTKVPQIAVYRYGARSEGQIRRLFAVVRAYLEDLRRGDFLYRPGWGCRTCAFRNEC
jgi:putative RecB family exonuclease